MPKTKLDVLKEWVSRGYLTHSESMAEKEKHLSFIDQAKEAILNYCNIPVKADMPDGLFYAWVEIGWTAESSSSSGQAVGTVKAITEGDTTVTFDAGSVTSNLTINGAIEKYRSTLVRYRQLLH